MSGRLKIVLASASPRRKELMEQLGIPFEVVDPGDVEEVASGRPEEAVSRNSLAKALKVAGGLEEGIVVGADTVVVKSDRILGKPRDPAEAKEMLRALSGSSHRVLTGLVVVDAGTGRVESDVVETLVNMLPLSEEDIDRYVATGEPLGKAGGYAIQGLGAVLVEGIDGCFHNVVGLPLSRLNTLLRKFGFSFLQQAGSPRDQNL
jgi:septum formation protein